MKQDKGKKMVVIYTGEVVETTGEMSQTYTQSRIIRVKFKSGKKEWFDYNELVNYIS